MNAPAPLRILHVVPTLSVGGAEQHLVDLVRHSDPQRLRHIVCVLQRPHALLPGLEPAADLVVLLDLPGAHPWVRGAMAVRALIRAHRPDIVQTWLYDADVAGRLAVLSTGRRVPVVTGLQAAIYDPAVIRLQHWPPAKMRAFRVIDRTTASLTRTQFVGLSSYVIESYRRDFGLKQSDVLAVIPNAIEPRAPGAGGAALRASLGIDDDALVVVNVGRLDEQKGQEQLVRAFAAAFADEPNAWMVIFGEGSRRDPLTKLIADLGLADRVLLPGVERDIGSAYAMADIFAFPSLHEGLGMAIIEAMAAGVACVGSDIPPLRAVLRDGACGRLVPPGDIDALADTLRSLASDPATRRDLAEEGRRRARDYFFTATLPRWEAAYRARTGGGP
ncbi:MAG: glycosyltransferase [Acidimicrobiales bacterium]